MQLRLPCRGRYQFGFDKHSDFPDLIEVKIMLPAMRATRICVLTEPDITCVTVVTGIFTRHQILRWPVGGSVSPEKKHILFSPFSPYTMKATETGC